MCLPRRRPCMDQKDPWPHIQSLPLYVAACNDLLCYETHDYDTRAWCCVERAIAFSFMYSGRIPCAQASHHPPPNPPLRVTATAPLRSIAATAS